MRTRLFMAVGVLLCLGAVSMTNGPTVVTASTASTGVAPAFTAAQLSAQPGADWISVGGNIQNQRYSTLNSINTGNVAGLKPAWSTNLDGSGVAKKYSQEATPLVYNGVMYISTGNDDVFALDATTGAHLWTFHSNIDQNNKTVCCGWDSRGVALGDGKVFVAQLDGYLTALDQTTGNVVWKVQNVRWQDGATMTMAPTYYNGMVYVGMSGGEFGARGSETAYDATTGAQKWRFFTVPGPGDIGSGTWPSNTEWQTGGATVWNNPSIDPATNNADLHDGERRRLERPWAWRQPVHLVVRRHRRDHRAVQVALPGRAPRPVGLRLPVADGACSTPPSTACSGTASPSPARRAGCTSSTVTPVSR